MQEKLETQHENNQAAEGHEEALYAALRQSEKKQNSRCQKGRAYFSEWHNVVSLLTLLFVGAYTVLTFFILLAAKEQATIGNKSLVAVQRAFVTVSDVASRPLKSSVDGSEAGTEYAAIVENSGGTPPENGQWLNGALRWVRPNGYTGAVPPIPQSLTYMGGWYPFNIGARSKQDFVRTELDMDLPAKKAILERNGAAYLFGMIVYDDVFQGGRNVKFGQHITKYCFALGDPAPGHNFDIVPVHLCPGKLNCTDNDCELSADEQKLFDARPIK
jgi:hypothetical protein